MIDIAGIIFIGGIAIIFLLIWKYREIQSILLNIALNKQDVIKVFFFYLIQGFALTVDVFSFILMLLFNILIFKNFNHYKITMHPVMMLYLVLSSVNILLVLGEQGYLRLRKLTEVKKQ